MIIVKRVLFGLLTLPFALVLALGASLIAVALSAIYLIVALIYPPEDEWSA